jgi:hypothetical protein
MIYGKIALRIKCVSFLSTTFFFSQINIYQVTLQMGARTRVTRLKCLLSDCSRNWNCRYSSAEVRSQYGTLFSDCRVVCVLTQLDYKNVKFK